MSRDNYTKLVVKRRSLLPQVTGSTSLLLALLQAREVFWKARALENQHTTSFTTDSTSLLLALLQAREVFWKARALEKRHRRADTLLKRALNFNGRYSLKASCTSSVRPHTLVA